MLNMPLIWLQHSPFFDYRIPGILLLTVIGIGSVVAALVVSFRGAHSGRFSQVTGLALIIWIVVQMIMLRTMMPIQIGFLLLGVAITWLGERLHRAA
jgi:hypothetical protein